MSRKRTIVFRISIGLNILLIAVVAWGFIKMNYTTERVLVTNVKHNLFELEERISSQNNDNWSDPTLVTTKLEELFDGLALSMNVGGESKTLSNNDMEILYELNYSLQKYQLLRLETLDSYSNLTDEDKNNYEELGETLREIGFKNSESNRHNSMLNHDSFMKHLEELVEKIDTRN